MNPLPRKNVFFGLSGVQGHIVKCSPSLVIVCPQPGLTSDARNGAGVVEPWLKWQVADKYIARIEQFYHANSPTQKHLIDMFNYIFKLGHSITGGFQSIGQSFNGICNKILVEWSLPPMRAPVSSRLIRI